MYCKQKLSSQCERTNSNTIEKGMYGGRTGEDYSLLLIIQVY